MPPSLANSVFAPDFNALLETIDAADENGFESVQLYVNKIILDKNYRDRLIEAINNSNLTNIVIHFPDFKDLSGNIVKASKILVNGIRKDIKLVGLIHYQETVKLKMYKGFEARGLADRNQPFLSVYVPRIKRMPIGVENSKIRVFDTEHVLRAFNFSRLNELPFVFDIGRIMYPKEGEELNEETKQEIYVFIENLIDQLDPSQDVIHTTGKTEWGTFRDFACALGAEGDITIPLIPALKRFMEKGGIVVFEHENLAQAIESKRNIES